MQSKDQSIERFANEAVFILQLNTQEAIKYIQRNADVRYSAANAALDSVVKFHKKPQCESATA